MMAGAGTKWIELVRVRSAAIKLAAALPHLKELLHELESSSECAETLMLQHALYEGDLAVVLVWHGSSAPARSRDGLMLAGHLGRLGSVEHAVWRPLDEQQEETLP